LIDFIDLEISAAVGRLVDAAGAQRGVTAALSIGVFLKTLA
jgi:hypothetical protein